MVMIGTEISSLQFRLMTGEDDEGQPKLSTRTIGRVKAELTDEEAFELGTEIMSLQKNPVSTLYRVDRKELIGSEE